MAFTLDQILGWSEGRLVNGTDLAVPKDRIRVDRPSTLSHSSQADLSFFFSREYEEELPSARPGILITGDPFVKGLQSSGLALWKASAVVACKDPYYVMAVLSEKFAQGVSSAAHIPIKEGHSGAPEIHASAVVHPSAELGKGVRIGPHCVVSEKVRIGAGTCLYPSCYVGPGAKIGSDSVLFPNVSIYEWSEIGERVRIHAGSVIGADGFGYAPKMESGKPVRHQKIYHLGRVVIGDDVEIGANSCVDRATFGETRIGSGSKLDNHVQVGHNAEMGEGAILCGATALAGSTKVGRFALVLGNSGVANNVRIGDYARVAAHTLVSKDVPPGETVAGSPQRDVKEYFKIQALLSRLLAERQSNRKMTGGTQGRPTDIASNANRKGGDHES